MIKNKTQDISSGNEKYIITAPIVFKNFTKKNAETTDILEMYLQRSTQDYYIKFCESIVTRKQLEERLSQVKGAIKALKLEVEFREGNWDICDENELQQSRVGKYVIIHQIL